MALMPLYTVSLTGSVLNRSTSYSTALGRIFGSRLVVFRPFSVSPKIGVISLPAYVVGMHRCGKPVRMLIAFPRPTVLPPPIDMIPSTFCSFATDRAFSVICTGVCIVASLNIATPASPMIFFTVSAEEICSGVDKINTAVALISLSSEGNCWSVPLPNLTRFPAGA